MRPYFCSVKPSGHKRNVELLRTVLENIFLNLALQYLKKKSFLEIFLSVMSYITLQPFTYLLFYLLYFRR